MVEDHPSPARRRSGERLGEERERPALVAGGVLERGMAADEQPVAENGRSER
jgi:hypothetical protein